MSPSTVTVTMKHLLIYPILLLTLTILAPTSSAQIQDATGGYKVEREVVAPPLSAMKKDLIGQKLAAFLASDTDGTERYSRSYMGKPLLLYFWNEDCATCADLAFYLQDVPASWQVLGMYSEHSEALAKRMDGEKLSYPTIGSAKFLSDGQFLGGLGYPKAFLIDEDGIVRQILSSDDLSATAMINYSIITDAIHQL